MPYCAVGGREVAFQGILFDKDGTLLDFVGLWGEWAKVITELLEQHVTLAGSSLLIPAPYILGFTLDQNGNVVDYDHQGPLAMATEEEVTGILAWQLYTAGIPWNEAILQIRQILKSAKEILRQKRNARSMPGLLSILEQCKQQGILLGVVTADRTEDTREHLTWSGLSPYFHTIVGNNRVKRGKPDPEMALLACDELGLAPEQVIIIGDSNGDMQMGRQAGAALMIGYAPDGNSDHLVDADVIINSYSELKWME